MNQPFEFGHRVYVGAAFLVAVALAGLWALMADPAAGQDPPSETVSLGGHVSVQGRAASQGVTILIEQITLNSSVPDGSGEVAAETVVEGLEVPWSLAFTPEGRMFVTERPGRIRVVDQGVLQEKPAATLDVATVSEAGLMGIALDPDFSLNGHLYVCYTYENPQDGLLNRVARLTEFAKGRAGDHRVLLDRIPGASNHNGCRLGFGPDGMLYATTGDAGRRDHAQDLDSLAGKVLRLMPDGSVPEDNPIPGSYVYSLGHRNPQGLDWHPVTQDLFITEHGPARDDEVNILEPGGNYGWPVVLGQAGEPGYVDPILTFTPTLALAGGSFYTGDGLPGSWSGNFIFANLKASHLHRVVLDPVKQRTVLSHHRLFQGEFGRLRAVAMGPDGYLYFTTSNRDGRGVPQPGDDRVMRLVALLDGPPTVETVASITPAPDGDFNVTLDSGGASLRLTLSLPGYLTIEEQIELPPQESRDQGERIELGEIRLLAGDLDGDGRIGDRDLSLMRDVFGRAHGGLRGTLARANLPADLNASGLVDVADLALLGSNWGLGR